MSTIDVAASTSTVAPDAPEQTTHRHVLSGCSPTPLAHYLKALAVLRLVCEQADPRARGFWRRDDFVLDTALSRDELIAFFLCEYEPTPIVSPWNGGSGFKLKKPKSELTAVTESDHVRLAAYRQTITKAFKLMKQLGFENKVPKSRKDEYLNACRSTFPDVALPWLDAAFVLTGDGPKYPPVLGTGGNDGRLDFSLNFLQRIAQLFDFDTGKPTHQADSWLEVALLGEADSHLEVKASIGQFFPGAAGGNNQDSSFEAKSLSNPWDFVLMLEGAVMFAAASVKQLDTSGPGQLSAPFCVRHVGVGHGSTDNSEEDDARPEMWLPVWERAVSSAELHTLMAEGRANVGRRGARDGVDFARAVGSLGIDRGISAFVRYGFQMRNGRAYFATPLNRIQVKRRPEIDVIDEIDAWLDRFTGKAKSDKAPSALKSASQSLREAIFAFCQTGAGPRLAAVLVELGNCERVLARRTSWATDNFVRPIAGLSQRWLDQAYDGSLEFRLAASLGSVFGNYATNDATRGRPDYVAIRSHLEPIDSSRPGYVAWADEQSNTAHNVVWHDGDPVDALNAIMRRRLILAAQAGLDTWPDRGLWTDIEDITAFVAGRVDMRRLADLLWGLMLVDWRDVTPPVFEQPEPASSNSKPIDEPDDEPRHPGALYALLKLCFAGHSLAGPDGESVDIPLAPTIHRHAADGQGGRASKRAIRRLRGSGLSPAIGQLHVEHDAARRAAAALLFPVSPADLHRLKRLVVHSSN
jgi:CRISPR-associated protein Csx17